MPAAPLNVLDVLMGRAIAVPEPTENSVLHAGSNPAKLSYSDINEYFARSNVFVAIVQDVYTYLGQHFVSKLGQKNKLSAFPIMQAGSHLIGSRSYTCYPPGTPVLCFEGPNDVAYIIGALPTPIMDQKYSVTSDFIATGSEVGFIHDAVHNKVKDLSAKTKGGLKNLSTGAPFDMLPGDAISINEFGVGYGLGKLMSFMRAGDTAKIEFFWLDYLVRMCAWNYEFFNAIKETRIFNDENEAHYTDFTALYPWEALGLTSRGEFTKPGESELKPGCKEGFYEPKYPDQTGIFRHQIFRGFLGDIEHELIVVPTGINGEFRLSKRDNLPAVLDIRKHADGQYCVRSAKGILFEKYIKIPAPKQIALPDDSSVISDAYDTKYQPSENGAIKKLNWQYSEETPGIRAAQSWDFHSYLFNVFGLSTLANHTKDWYVPEESEVPLGTSAIYTDYSQLGQAFSLPLPKTANLDVDHRTGTTRYYESRSFFELHDDGSITIEDGYGSQISMTGGNIFFKASGDVWMMPGRSAVTWAPHDIIQRAGNSIDITASKKDIRFKAEKNLHMLAGNCGDAGGVFIECRNNKVRDFKIEDLEGEDYKTCGIVLHANKGPLLAYGKDVYIRAGAEDPKEGDLLVLDAGRGKSNIMISGKKTFVMAKENVSLSTGTTLEASEEKSTHLLLQPNAMTVDGKQFSSATIAGTLKLVNPTKGRCHLTVNGTVTVEGSVISSRNGIFDGNVMGKALAQKVDSSFVGGGAEYSVTDGIEDQISRIKEQLLKFRDNISKRFEKLDERVYKEESCPGHEKFIKRLMFSCRSSSQYIQGGIELYEAPWQFIARKAGKEKYWDEPAVVGPKGKTYPHPGKDNWADSENFVIVENNKAFDFDAGCAKTRDEATNIGETPTRKKMKDWYTIVVQEF